MYIDASNCKLKCLSLCVCVCVREREREREREKLWILGSEGPGICGARIFPVMYRNSQGLRN